MKDGILLSRHYENLKVKARRDIVFLSQFFFPHAEFRFRNYM